MILFTLNCYLNGHTGRKVKWKRHFTYYAEFYIVYFELLLKWRYWPKSEVKKTFYLLYRIWYCFTLNCYLNGHTGRKVKWKRHFTYYAEFYIVYFELLLKWRYWPKSEVKKTFYLLYRIWYCFTLNCYLNGHTGRKVKWKRHFTYYTEYDIVLLWIVT